jgi:hypothetical protein
MTSSSGASVIGRPGSTAGVSDGVSGDVAQVDVDEVERSTLVEPSEQQHVVHESAHARRLVLDAAHGVGLLVRSLDRPARQSSA